MERDSERTAAGRVGRRAKTAGGIADAEGWGADGEEELDDDAGNGIDEKEKGRGFKKFAVEEGELSTEITRLARVMSGGGGILDRWKPNAVGGTRNAEYGIRNAPGGRQKAEWRNGGMGRK